MVYVVICIIHISIWLLLSLLLLLVIRLRLIKTQHIYCIIKLPHHDTITTTKDILPESSRCVNIWSYQQPSVAWHGHFSTFLPTFRSRNYASYETMRPITIRHLVDRFAQSPSENGSIEPKHPNHQLRMSMTGCLGVEAFLRSWTLPSLKLRALLPLKIGKNPKMYTDCLPSIHFQVRAASFRECVFFFLSLSNIFS